MWSDIFCSEKKRLFEFENQFDVNGCIEVFVPDGDNAVVSIGDAGFDGEKVVIINGLQIRMVRNAVVFLRVFQSGRIGEIGYDFAERQAKFIVEADFGGEGGNVFHAGIALVGFVAECAAEADIESLKIVFHKAVAETERSGGEKVLLGDAVVAVIGFCIPKNRFVFGIVVVGSDVEIVFGGGVFDFGVAQEGRRTCGACRLHRR